MNTRLWLSVAMLAAFGCGDDGGSEDGGSEDGGKGDDGISGAPLSSAEAEPLCQRICDRSIMCSGGVPPCSTTTRCVSLLSTKFRGDAAPDLTDCLAELPCDQRIFVCAVSVDPLAIHTQFYDRCVDKGLECEPQVERSQVEEFCELDGMLNLLAPKVVQDLDACSDVPCSELAWCRTLVIGDLTLARLTQPDSDAAGSPNAADEPSPAPCIPGTLSTPGMDGDPCPQAVGSLPGCPGLGTTHMAVSTCQADGRWSSSCECTPRSAGSGTAGNGAGICGNGQIEPGEACDGTVPMGMTCASLNMGSGMLSCESCRINTAMCVPGQ